VATAIYRDKLATLALVPAEREQRIELTDFERTFAALSPDHREVLGLIVIDALSYKEVARICGCTAGTVKSRLNRARAVLTQMFLDQGEPAEMPLTGCLPAHRPGDGVHGGDVRMGSALPWISMAACMRGYTLALLLTVSSGGDGTWCPYTIPKGRFDERSGGAGGPLHL
jgi:predicted DNA-binding protein (UPF0251 family)